MKLGLSSSICLLALSIPAFASAATADVTAQRNNVYVGIFGGGGSSNDFNGSQFGTAFILEAGGGPLAVNAFGNVKGESSAFYGAQLGYKAQEIPLNASSRWSLEPAAELEGFSMSDSTFKGSLINDTSRIPEHDFEVSYPMSRNIFLANAVLGFNNPCVIVHPYIGLGIGSAVVRITNADATQISPPEVGVNHYNASTNANDTTFAGQIKLGLSYDFNSYVSVFADYRWLYVGSTGYTFGSTISPGHVETSAWRVNLDAQKYNMGDVGIRVSM